MKLNAQLALFVAITVGGGALIGTLSAPGPWYAELTKPAFNPPNWIFGPVWTLLYALIGIAGWRVWQLADAARLKTLWVAQLALNFAWSPVFFGLQQTGAALVVIIALLVAIAFFIAASRHKDRLAAGLFLPYLAWVGFATVLNAAIFILN